MPKNRTSYWGDDLEQLWIGFSIGFYFLGNISIIRQLQSSMINILQYYSIINISYNDNQLRLKFHNEGQTYADR